MFMQLYLIAVVMTALSGLPALIGMGTGKGERVAAYLLAAGCLVGLGGIIGALFLPQPPGVGLPWELPGAHLLLRLDGLAAVFLLPAFLIGGLGSLYGLGYWPGSRYGMGAGWLRVFYGLLVASLVVLPACRNGILFLLVWEVMAVSGFLLILAEHLLPEARRAALIYLVATHTGTLALFGLFALLAQVSGSFDFPSPGTLAGGTGWASAIFLLALFGFGIKAGLIPFHIWLPEAHAAAPSHVSALMSGVMIKMGIYGIIRVVSFFATIPVWWGWTVLILGAVSGVMGVVFALAQHDIKRLLAYHSVENIGIILLGLGLALLGRSYDLPELTALGLAGALLHVINHGLFKSLLFLAAGSVIQATGTRRIDLYGGLHRQMPVTALCFLGGAVAICGLPPLNGFVSEWLIYLGIFQGQTAQAPLPLSLTLLIAPTLALIGGLALACFVKVYGVTFLGEARHEWPKPVGESPLSMRLPMVVILGCCLAIGLFPALVLPLLQSAEAAWRPGSVVSELSIGLAPVGWISLSAGLLILISWSIFMRQQISWRESLPRPSTWGCGYLKPTSTMQYTATSFAEIITGLFRWGLWSEIRQVGSRRFFPDSANFSIHTPDIILDRLIFPLSGFVSRIAFMIRSILHHGIIGIYLLYICLTLVFLLIFVLGF
ncbi:MAG: hydrogenase [Proteobacteria bacterium]|nr:hydrogenase [Pseudomonadota bacterium]MBU1687428.1 hydrogenase [Pseudomonadota bacterium]